MFTYELFTVCTEAALYGKFKDFRGPVQIKFKDFQASVLFSSTFKALNLGEKKSSTFKDFPGCVGTLAITIISSCTYHHFLSRHLSLLQSVTFGLKLVYHKSFPQQHANFPQDCLLGSELASDLSTFIFLLLLY